MNDATLTQIVDVLLEKIGPHVAMSSAGPVRLETWERAGLPRRYCPAHDYTGYIWSWDDSARAAILVEATTRRRVALALVERAVRIVATASEVRVECEGEKWVRVK
jgi:hypothetical protein